LPAETVTAIPERLAPLAEQAVPLSSASPTQTAGTSATSRIARSDVATPDPDAPDMPGNPAMAISPTQAAAAQLPSRSADTSMVASLTPAPTAAMVSPPAPDATRPDTGRPDGNHPDESRIILRVSAVAWVMVKDHAGAVLLNRTMKAGETWPVPPRSDLLLTAGNAGGTEILLDGVATPSLGASGTVRRDMPLDPDQIKDGKLAAATAPQLASRRARQ
jgi:cytoskeleton protein RodZ